MSDYKTDENRTAAAVVAAPARKDYTPKTIGKWAVLFLEGMIIGVGAILPGVSGGVLCVIFGIYQPMMDLLAHPFKSLPKYIRLFIPVILGWAVGFVGLSGIIAKLAAKDATVVTSLFIGLIAGMLPSLFKEGARDGRTRTEWTALFVSTAALLAFFLTLKFGTALNVTPSIPWFLFCGALWGVSLIVPGMSSSSVLLFLGLYYPMSKGIAELDMAVVIPFILGIAATVLLLARGVNRLFEKHYGVAFHCIIGFVIASTIPIIPYRFTSAGECVLSVVCAVAGFFAAYYMDKLSSRLGSRAHTEQLS